MTVARVDGDWACYCYCPTRMALARGLTVAYFDVKSVTQRFWLIYTRFLNRLLGSRPRWVFGEAKRCVNC